jgi:hypothetical protein
MVKVVNNELGGTEKKAVMAKFQVLTRQLSKGTNENHRKITSGEPGLTNAPKCHTRRWEIPSPPSVKIRSNVSNRNKHKQQEISLNNENHLWYRKLILKTVLFTFLHNVVGFVPINGHIMDGWSAENMY